MRNHRSRILYMPNEHGSGRQRGPRLALAQLLKAGLVDEVSIFSYRLRLQSDSNSATFAALLDTVRLFKPTLVLVQHPAGTGLHSHHWAQLRKIRDFSLLYHEGDAYDRLRKRIPPEVKSLAASADISFSVGASRQLQYFRRAGSRDARWTPSVFNPHDFGSRPISKTPREYDVVMIANESSSRLPLMSMPGSHGRVRLVQALERRFGRRFAIYGSGWRGPSAKGPLDYLDQEQVVRSAWVSTGWDHYPLEARFFSDRLPIALASGTVHVTSTHPGYENFFPRDLGFLHHERSVEGVLKRIEQVISTNDRSQLLQHMREGQQFAHRNFRQDDNLVQLLNAGGAQINAAEAADSWHLPVTAIDQV